MPYRPESYTMKTPEEAQEIMRKWEGIVDGDPSTAKLDPYLCPAGYWTIGWGHVVRDAKGRMLKGKSNRTAAYNMYPGGISIEQAKALFSADLVEFENHVQRILRGHPYTSEQFGAMVSLCFNIGPANFASSSVARLHKAGAYAAAADAFLKWNKARVNGKLTALRGLTARRADERRLYLKGS